MQAAENSDNIRPQTRISTINSHEFRVTKNDKLNN
jgi:hypothetical protein